ncbi:TPA: IS66 family transposase [Escherichia coli]|nr:IS66 family transposase [Escherichia coli]
MRILNCYMANDSKGHFVTAKEAAKHNRQDVLCCVSCGCPLTLQRGNDGQPPWFEHDQMTVAEKILLRCTWLDPAEKEARRLHLQGMTVPDYTVKVRKWFCVMCDEDYEGEKCCPNCGGSLSYLGEDTAEQLELMRSAFRVIRTVREKHACTQCDAIVQAPAPSRPIERGIAGPGLLARVLTSKYAEHTPLYCQSEIYGRQGVELSRSLLSGWVDACCRLLSPLEEALHGYVMTDGKLHADDTPVQVLLPGNKKTKTGRLWAYVRDDRNAGSALAPAVWFAYSPDRKGIHPQTHLACFSGVLQADAYAGFNELYRNGGITEAACWAHARRKIHDVHVRIPSALTEEALEQIGQLYAIEADIRGMPAEQRLAERQRKTKPLLKSLESWLREKMKTLFFGSGHGGERGALLYSLIGTCKLNDVDPESYLRHVPGVIADWPVNRVSELLPWRIALPAE